MRKMPSVIYTITILMVAASTLNCSPRKRSHSRERSPTNKGASLYVANLSFRTTESTLRRLFSKYGKLESCKLVTDPRSRQSREFAFIVYEEAQDAQDAIRYLHHYDLDGRSINVELSKRSRPRSPTPGEYLGKEPLRRYGIPSRGYPGGGGGSERGGGGGPPPRGYGGPAYGYYPPPSRMPGYSSRGFGGAPYDYYGPPQGSMRDSGGYAFGGRRRDRSPSRSRSRSPRGRSRSRSYSR
eukprot:TRINITY_DN1026_c0_g2_i3.p1 TRINITY_DN1026_c0_g2~~TRINITY_DN1026_c0_g2_i3.p1  ORF type:complete len:240 (+),score=28.46 TRINITY_DN1026_c0_g2_i3:626-1345(+)